MMQLRTILTALIAGLTVLPACASGPAAAPGAGVPTARGGVTFIRPKCEGVNSCLLGRVVEAETYAPMSAAAVFLELENGTRAVPGKKGVNIVTLTDDQGVFTVADAPAGRYRLAIYKDARKLEVRGLELGTAGITMVPVRLPRG